MRERGWVEWRDLGPGVWVLRTEAGNIYELQGWTENPPPRGLIEVTGEQRAGVMSWAMVGPVMRVTAWRSLE